MKHLHTLIQRLRPAKAPAPLSHPLPVLSAAELKFVAGGSYSELPRIGGLLVAPSTTSSGSLSA